MNKEAQKKWDIMHTFSYSYICQPPQKYWEDEEFLFQRDILLQQVHHDVHRTDWEIIYGRYSELRPIQAAYKDAKEYYDAFLKGETTPEYESIRAYAERVDEERVKLRASKPDDRPVSKLRRSK